MTDFYPSANAGMAVNRLWNATPVNFIDLRAELHTILFGHRGFIPQGHLIVIRHMDRMCPCMLEEKGLKHKEADPLCSVCHGEGYVYTDHLVTAWRSLIDAQSGALPATFQEHVAGLAYLNAVNFFMEYNVDLTFRDKIFEIDLSASGAIPLNLDPSKYIEKYKITQLIIYRGDNGRIEYKRAVCEKEEW